MFPQQLGKLMMLGGLALAAAGAVIYLMARSGLGRLPGDLSFGGRAWRIYIPLGTSILISILLTAALWILSRWRR
jgi:hypothetical protein